MFLQNNIDSCFIRKLSESIVTKKKFTQKISKYFPMNEYK